ncbi:Nucleoid occlusion factor SlmA [Flavobacteriales bacterium]|nr:Nucleoid occlusion factor SlmA [Flavobacteriales bacterium]MCL4817045.1 TetR/AcrR family transcriptional regulator [Flavobacteriales bacterium]WKZ76092.1 MAG: TetR/AcrR family transcriptional regulator [Vicingaceae bacterium]GIK70528.1 MAG: TetR family transcriptional regulator [Bacteroidota bacterium]CAG0986708.1 Nucleoid occlusion factor SlmA [Flavobacteriales bacterium]
MTNKDFTERQIEIMEAATLRIDKFGIQELTIKNLASDLSLSEAALYRHFKSKNEILLGLITFFMIEMKERVSGILTQNDKKSGEILRQIFSSQLNNFVANPSICSVIFSEGIFQFNKELSTKLNAMMDMMHNNISSVVAKGQSEGVFSTLLSADATTTIIMGSMRMVVLKWKLSGNKSNLIKDGTSVLNGLLKMIEK